MTITAQQLRELAGKATQGVWIRHNNPKKWVSTLAPVSDEEWRNNSDNDAALVITLRNNLHTIISALELQEQLSRSSLLAAVLRAREASQ